MGILTAKAQDDGSRAMLIWGRVTRDAKLEFTRNKNIPKVSFAVAYDSKKYMNCSSMGDNDKTSVAALLEKGDEVLIGGIWSSRKYMTKDGEEKTWSELKIEFIMPQGAPAASQSAIPQRDTANGAADNEYFNDSDFAELNDDDYELPF